MLTRVKQKVQQVLSFEARAAHRLGLTPNVISAIGFVLAVLSAFAYAKWHVNELYAILATAMLLLSGFCDAIDGIVARLYKQATAFGGFLDSLLDRYADAVVYGGAVLGGLCDAVWGLIAMIGSFLVSYSRARAEAVGVKMESVGFAERAERIIILAVASIATILWPAYSAINIGMILLAILSNLTVLQRSVYAYHKLKKRESVGS